MDIFNYNVVPSLDLLKNDIISLICPESIDRTSISFSIKIKISPLKGHKRCHNFIDTYQCNKVIEDTSHFLLSCPFKK